MQQELEQFLLQNPELRFVDLLLHDLNGVDRGKRIDAAAAASEGRSCSRSRGAATSASVAPSTDVAGPTSLSRSPADADEAGAGRIRSLIASLKTSTMLT